MKAKIDYDFLTSLLLLSDLCNKISERLLSERTTNSNGKWGAHEQIFFGLLYVILSNAGIKKLDGKSIFGNIQKSIHMLIMHLYSILKSNLYEKFRSTSVFLDVESKILTQVVLVSKF